MRYRLMKPSTVEAGDGTYYKDPLTLPLDRFEQQEVGLTYKLRPIDIERFDILIATHYGTSKWADLVLMLNGVSFLWELSGGDTIFLPSRSDLARFVSRNSA